jgi:hypothetical protein
MIEMEDSLDTEETKLILALMWQKIQRDGSDYRDVLQHMINAERYESDSGVSLLVGDMLDQLSGTLPLELDLYMASPIKHSDFLSTLQAQLRINPKAALSYCAGVVLWSVGFVEQGF